MIPFSRQRLLQRSSVAGNKTSCHLYDT